MKKIIYPCTIVNTIFQVITSLVIFSIAIASIVLGIISRQYVIGLIISIVLLSFVNFFIIGTFTYVVFKDNHLIVPKDKNIGKRKTQYGFIIIVSEIVEINYINTPRIFNSLGKTNTIDNHFGHIGIDFMMPKMKNDDIKRIVATRFSKAQ
jgi:hypothetical protein